MRKFRTLFSKPNDIASYSKMQSRFYRLGTSDHLEHNENGDYWSVLLSNVDDAHFRDGRALDFACGKGRNVKNLLKLAHWESVDGSDLSEVNINYCRTNFKNPSKFYLTNGQDTGVPFSNYYDFVMSTISLQHIPVYDIRRKILLDILRVLRPGGRFSFQMGFGVDLSDTLGRPRSSYFENAFNANSTNGDHDVRVTSVTELEDDLKDIGFFEIQSVVRESFSDFGHPNWIYVHCRKPEQI